MSRRAVPPPSAADPLADAAARFREDLARLIDATAGPLLLAVSGGPDSMAMLTLAATVLPGGIAAASVDHGLRAAAAGEAAAVAAWCATLAVPHATLVPETPLAGTSIQAQARATRYGLLAAHARALGATAIATAHHADDAAETFLMRAARGSGLAGLAGVRTATEIAGMRVIRPLLDWRRAELRAIVRRLDVPFVDDPSNLDPAYDRTRFRRLIEANEWLDAAQLARSAAMLAEADADVRTMTGWLWSTRAIVADVAVTLSIEGLPRELLRRLARRAVGTVRDAAGIGVPLWSDAVNIEPLLDALERDKRATQAGILVSPHGSQWRFRPAPPRKGH